MRAGTQQEPTSSAREKWKCCISVAMVATRLTLARDCPTQLRGPSAKGKYRLARLLSSAQGISYQKAAGLRVRKKQAAQAACCPLHRQWIVRCQRSQNVDSGLWGSCSSPSAGSHSIFYASI